MLISEAFPSKYLKHADLKGHEVTLTMERVENEELGDETKPVLFFEGKGKGLVLNRTNATAIAKAYGNDTKEWRGKQIVLFPATTSMQGSVVDCIRLRVPSSVAMSDDIPF